MVRSSVLDLAHRVAERVARSGAEAVVLVGSHAVGTAHSASDVDLVAIGAGPEHETERCAGHLVVVSWRTAEVTRSAFVDPPLAGTAVPAWRTARIVWDGTGVAARLQAETQAWTWGPQLEEAADRWVADRLLYLTEEVLRMAAGFGQGRWPLAAANAAFIAMDLTTVAAVQRRLLLPSVNDKWSRTAEAEGERWTAARDLALGVMTAPLIDRLRAALELYRLATDRAAHLLPTAMTATVAGIAEQADGLLGAG